ncbi:MAG: RNA polymerase sigma factor [Alloprevotella sp.]
MATHTASPLPAVTDRDIVDALLRHDEALTRDFFYRRCYPLFKSVFDNYCTDSETCQEFISEIYLHIMQPNPDTGRCKLQEFEFRSTLFTWLKTVCLFYCYKKFERREKMPLEPIVDFFDDDGVRIDTLSASILTEDIAQQRDDVETILRLMPNRRYSMLIRLRYLEERTNEETAQLLGMNMNTFYNKHKLAKEQFIKTLKKEEYGYEL